MATSKSITATTKEMLVDWLKDAHAMESQAVEILEKQGRRLEHYPQMKAKVQEHTKQSKQQAQQVEQCLKQLGSDTSALKEGMGKLSGNLAAFGNAAAGDEVMKNHIADYAFEHYEIASYRALVSAAEALGEEEVRRTCENILKQEEEMAAWLGEQLPQVTQQYLQREASPQQEAKA